MIPTLITFILFVIFNVCFFLSVQTPISITLWISYGFVVLSFVNVFLNPVVAKRYQAAKTHFVRNQAVFLTIYLIAVCIVVFLSFTISITVKYLCAVEILIVGFYLIAMLINMSVSRRIETSQLSVKSSKEFLSAISLKVTEIAKLSDGTIDEAVSGFLEKIKYSPVISIDDVKTEESAILSKLNALSSTSESSEIVRVLLECSNLLDMRNLKIKKK